MVWSPCVSSGNTSYKYKYYILDFKVVVESVGFDVDVKFAWVRLASGSSPLESSHADFLRHRHGID